MREIEGINLESYAGKAALAVKTKARGIFGDDLLIFELLDLITFMLLNNKFANKGFFITDENKEEKYIEIIETCDEQLIEDLEKYIFLLDKIKILQNKKNEYDSIIDSLKYLNDYNDQSSVNNIIESYLRR
jgi:hypothetical protein